VDRQGRASPLPGLPPALYRNVKVSPDGTRLAVDTQGGDVSIYDFSQATLSRLTADPAADYNPVWTPDGQRIIFSSRRAGYPELFWRPADGTGQDERFFEHGKNLTDLRANGWSADGKQLLFTEVSASGGIGQLAIERPSDAKMLVNADSPASVSPDGRWIAYHSDTSAQTEIYVERYPELGNRQQISRGGGRLPIWSRNGRELFFSSLDTRQMLAVQVQSGTMLVAGPPKVLFEMAMLVPPGGSRTYDIAPDGRFLIIRSNQSEAATGSAPQIVVVQNWTEELKRLVPTR
jgi:Tol biopolymer transport system component